MIFNSCGFKEPSENLIKKNPGLSFQKNSISPPTHQSQCAPPPPHVPATPDSRGEGPGQRKSLALSRTSLCPELHPRPCLARGSPAPEQAACEVGL